MQRSQIMNVPGESSVTGQQEAWFPSPQCQTSTNPAGQVLGKITGTHFPPLISTINYVHIHYLSWFSSCFFLFGTTCPLFSRIVCVSGSYHEASSHRSVFEKIAENATTAGQLLYYYRIRGELFQYYSGVSCSAEITWFSCLSVRFCLVFLNL